MVGFNRRFAPLLGAAEGRSSASRARSVTRYLVNAGRLDADSWYTNEELEGSRFTGEGGHFIDTVSWWADSLPERGLRGPRPRARRRAGHRAVPQRGQRGDQLRHRRQLPLPQGDARLRGRRPERAARQLPDGRRMVRATAEHHAVARRPGQGPAARAGAASPRPCGPARRCPSRSSPWSPPPAPPSRWGTASRAAARSGCERADMPPGWAGTRAGPPGCHRPRWPGGPVTRPFSWPGHAVRYGPSSSPRPCRHARAQRRFTAVLPPVIPPAGCPRRPGPRSWPRRTGSCAANGRCSASRGPTWCRPTGSTTR